MELSALTSFNLAIVVLFLGRFLNSKFAPLQRYNIPEPVTGGLLFCFGAAAFHLIAGKSLIFDLEARDFLLLYFFAGIGLNSDLKSLVSGGIPLLILLAITVVYMLLQNFTGIGVAVAMGQAPVSGMMTGTTSLIGGHGTAIAWAPTFESDYGITGAAELGIAAATCGLVMASLMGGPVAQLLMKRHKLSPEPQDEPIVDVSLPTNDTNSQVNADMVMRTLLWLNVSLGLGWGINEGLAKAGVMLPPFVTGLFAAIILTNTLPRLMPKLMPAHRWPAQSRSLALISEISLGIFLAMSLMSLQLWTLAEMAGPLFVAIGAQVVVAFLFSVFVVFNLMGRDYEAAVICSGFSGISLGATPTAMANMTAVTKRYGPAHKAFIIVPLVCGFFVDIANSVIIKLFLGWFG